MTFEGVAEFTI